MTRRWPRALGAGRPMPAALALALALPHHLQHSRRFLTGKAASVDAYRDAARDLDRRRAPEHDLADLAGGERHVRAAGAIDRDRRPGVVEHLDHPSRSQSRWDRLGPCGIDAEPLA